MEADVGANNESVFVQVKLCRLIVIGFVQMPNAREWKGTRVKMRRGSVGGQNYFLPKNFGEYLVERAKYVPSVHASISEPQMQKIELQCKDMDRAASSDTFEAMSQDVEMFGPAAFRRPKNKRIHPSNRMKLSANHLILRRRIFTNSIVNQRCLQIRVDEGFCPPPPTRY